MTLKDLLDVINLINAIKIKIYQLDKNRQIKSDFTYDFTDEPLKYIKSFLPSNLLTREVVYCYAIKKNEFEVGVFY